MVWCPNVVVFSTKRVSGEQFTTLDVLIRLRTSLDFGASPYGFPSSFFLFFRERKISQTSEIYGLQPTEIEPPPPISKPCQLRLTSFGFAVIFAFGRTPIVGYD